MHAGYDGLLLDLDGTVYRGQEAIPGAAAAISGLREAGIGIGFVTNNASRAPRRIAEHLASLDIEVTDDEVVTSAQAGAAVLADRLASGSDVLVVGTDALAAEVQALGLTPVRAADAGPAGVVQGHSPETGWRQLAEACLAIRAGSLWVACNVDPTLPTERGQVVGNGALVVALRAATGAEPVVAGKPARPLVEAAVARLGARHPLMIGDRLDTDIAAADGLMDSLLVLTGVTDAAELLAAPVGQRPTFVGVDLTALAQDPEVLRVGARPGWRCTITDVALVLHGDTAEPGTPQDALRTLCHHWWAAAGGVPTVTAADDTAAAALAAMGLAGPGPRGAPDLLVG
ncbi:MAG: HAD-IIA family hydrolase [Pseudonocardiaceae bacterium]|nr:HAD-IIA family hydrolase [Pseudonocardiaceae bacterium]